MDYMNVSFSDGTFLDDQKMPILDINQLIEREPGGINYISIHGSLDLTEKSRIRGEGHYKEVQKIIDPRGYFKGSNLNELFMIYPLEVGGYSDSIKSPYLDMLYYFRKMMEKSQCLIIMGYSLRDPTISSIIEEVITIKIRNKDLKPLSADFEERISQAPECKYKLLVFTRNPENIKQNLEKMGLNNIGQTFIPITTSFPVKIVNETEPYFNDKYDVEYKEFLSDLLQKLEKIQYVKERISIDDALEQDYNLRI